MPDAARRVVLIDAGDPRNWETRGIHGYLGLEGITPGELRGRGRDDARRFGATLVDATVSRVDRVDDDRSSGNEARALELGGGMSLDCDQIFFTTRYCRKGAGCSTSIVAS